MFLNGELKEKVYVEQHQGFVIEEQEGKVYKLLWVETSSKSMVEQHWKLFMEKSFKKSMNKPALNVKEQDWYFNCCIVF